MPSGYSLPCSSPCFIEILAQQSHCLNISLARYALINFKNDTQLKKFHPGLP
jgi:hypothetical protein